MATCRKVFVMFKKGNHERLGRDQIKAMCNYLAEQIPTRKPSFEEINDILEILDDNGDGEISFNEFLGNIDAVNKFIESLAIKNKTADGGLNKDGSNPAKKSKSSVNLLLGVSSLLEIKEKKKKTTQTKKKKKKKKPEKRKQTKKKKTIHHSPQQSKNQKKSRNNKNTETNVTHQKKQKSLIKQKNQKKTFSASISNLRNNQTKKYS